MVDDAGAGHRRFELADRAYRRSNRLTRSHPDWQEPDTILDAALGDDDPHDPALREAAAAAKSPVTLLAALARADLAAGDLAGATALLRRALAREANHLHLQTLHRRASGVADDPTLAERFCSAPFESLETAPGGQVYFCCPAWLPVPIGNLEDGDAEAVWNSPAARDIRASIHDGSYRYCSRTHCPKLSGDALPARTAVRQPRLRRIVESATHRLDDGPKRIVLAHDRSCNLSCPSCRTHLILARKDEQAELNRMAERVLFPLLANAVRVRVTASGDPFGSAHFQYVLRHLDRAQNPRLRVDLQTNGLLLTPRLWDQLGLDGRVDQLLVSVDAATAATYAEVRRGGHFATLLGALGFIAELRRQRRVERFRLDFVVQARNFREMGAFADLARRYGADGVKFQMIRSWGTWTPAEFARQDISDRAHPEYAAFLDELNDPRLAPPFVEFWGMGTALSDAGLRRAAAPATA